MCEATGGASSWRSRKSAHWFLALAIACYTLAGASALVLASGLPAFPLFLLWCGYALGLLVGLIRLGGAETGCSVSALVLAASIFASIIGQTVHEDYTLVNRGVRVQAVVVDKRVERGSRGDEEWIYRLQDENGRSLKGPDMWLDDNIFSVGEAVTVLEDPQGELSPQTPGRASPTGDLLGYVAVMAGCLIAVGWTALRGRTTGRRMKSGNRSPATFEEQERSREILRARQFDRRGYIRVIPGDYPSMSYQEASQIARQEGLLAESFGNRGYWRFGEKVVEEVQFQSNSLTPD